MMESTARTIKVLTVCREIPDKVGVHGYSFAEYIYEQNQAVSQWGVEFEYFLLTRNGVMGYLHHLRELKRVLKTKKYDIVHVHGGHIGLMANLQRMVPVVTTYHGSDINLPSMRRLSRISVALSRYNIFVAEELAQLAKAKKKFSVLPCGVDFDLFKPMDKAECRNKLSLAQGKKYIFFAGQSGKKVKNYPLAREVVNQFPEATMIELKELSREEVALMLNACDCLLLTSISEGSPMIVKEAIACNTPIVTTPVGDVGSLSKGADGFWVCDHSVEKLAESLREAIIYGKTNNRANKDFIDNKIISKKIYQIFRTISGI